MSLPVCKKCDKICDWNMVLTKDLIYKRCNYEIYVVKYKHSFIPRKSTVTYTKSFYEKNVFDNLEKNIDI